tara:strand:- start:40 stop:576 length:537 start_codon:yes stop_codon:yes gene_type:complete
MFKIIAIIITILGCNYLNAETMGEYTGLKMPRFVSTKTNESNLRVGADTTYPIILKYKFINIPLEIVDEYKDWRKIIDIDGNEGWLHKRLLKGNRYGIINNPYEEPVHIFNRPKGRIIGKIGKRNIVKIEHCLQNWCFISINNNKGWINKINIWGVYKNESFNIPFYQFIINFIWKFI